MLRYVFRRLLTAIPTLFVIVTISFFLIRVAPGGPFNLERALSPEIMANLEAQFGLDEPLWLQYLHYLGNLLRGDFGPSYICRDFTVTELFAKGLPDFDPARRLGADPGAAARRRARHRRRAQPEPARRLCGDRAGDRRHHRADLRHRAGDPARLRADLELLPVGGWGDGALLNKIRPMLTLALAADRRLRPADARLDDRGAALRPYPHRARLGLPTGRWSSRHALRGAILPIVSFSGPAAAALLTGSVVVETIFAIPGVGRYFVDAALNRDYTLVMGTVVLIASSSSSST